MRQREEHHVRALQRVGVGRHEGAVGERDEVRVQVGHGAAGAASRGQRSYPQVGVPEQQAYDLAAGVPGRADDSNT